MRIKTALTGAAAAALVLTGCGGVTTGSQITTETKTETTTETATATETKTEISYPNFPSALVPTVTQTVTAPPVAP
jgi:hypothetical protein